MKNIIKKVKIKSWRDFDSRVRELPYKEWVFRGQKNEKWDIKSSLYVLFEEFENLAEIEKFRTRDKHEKHLIKNFQASYHLFSGFFPEKDNYFEWCTIMQHYGAPTRMIDFSLSPYIALYFALESGKEDCAVYAVYPKFFRDIDEQLKDYDDYEEVIFTSREGSGRKAFFIKYESKTTNPRLIAQQGCFIVPSNNYYTLIKIIDLYEIEDDEDDVFIKFIIPSSLRLEGLKLLRKLNITSSVLFPGIDGFCKSLRYEIVDNLPENNK